MMRNDSIRAGRDKFALAVRNPQGEIVLEEWENEHPTMWYRKTPFIRGIFNFISMMITGYKTLMRSADLAGLEEDEEEPGPIETKLRALMGDNFSKLFGGAVMILGLMLAVGLFMALPAGISFFIGKVVTHPFLLTAIEGLIKILIFVAYLALVSRLKDIQRLFQYHGAEHKTIFCFEHGEALTVENVRKYTRFHPRCGTSFLLIVLIISILVNSIVTWESIAIRVLLKLLLLPLVVGIAYEIIKFVGRHDNPLTRIVSAPGMWLQRLTTKEPDDSQIEVAIRSIEAVIPENREDAVY